MKTDKQFTVKDIDPSSFFRTKAQDLVVGEYYCESSHYPYGIFQLKLVDKAEGNYYYYFKEMKKSGEYIESVTYKGLVGFNAFGLPDYDFKLKQ